jgi:hypothetical protein
MTAVGIGASLSKIGAFDCRIVSVERPICCWIARVAATGARATVASLISVCSSRI